MNNRLKDALLYCWVFETGETYGKSNSIDPRFCEIDQMREWNKILRAKKGTSFQSEHTAVC